MWGPSPEQVYAELAKKMLTDPLWWVAVWQDGATRFWTIYREEFTRLQEQSAPE